MRKYIISLLFFMGICTFSLFKSEQIQNKRIEVEALTTNTTQTTSTTTFILTTTKCSTTSTTTETTTTTTTTETTTTTTTTTTLPPETEPITEPEPVTEVETVEAEPQEQPVEPVQENVQEAPQEAQPEENLRLLGNLKITGYVSTGRATASGVMPYVGGVAMSRSYGLPFGTKIYIDGLGYYTINDTGCKYGVVDVFCSSLSECYNLTSYANVYVVE